MKKKGVTDFCFIFYDDNHHYKGSENYQAMLVPLKRKSIYGERKIIPLDKDNIECSRVFYDENDMTLYPKKAIGLCKLNQDGTIYAAEKNEPQEKESASQKNAGIENINLSEMKKDTAKFYINLEAEKIYTLESYDTYAIAALIGEKIFYEEFSGGQRRIWMFQRKGTVFVICGTVRENGTFAEKNIGYQIDDQPLVSDISDLDDIDFEMF